MPELLYRSLYRIRRVEEKIAEIYPTDKIQSPVHLSIGQEAISVAVCAALRPDDIVFGSYRCHAFYLAKGGNLNAMIAELYGKSTGCARGKGGSMHLVDVAAGVMGASAVVATTIPQAVGYALGVRMRRRSNLVVCFFGDGAMEEGVLHESLNFAAVKRLPVLFVCENNSYAIHSRLQTRQAFDIADLARSYKIPVEKFEDMDVLRLRDRVRTAAASIRANESGPQFFECACYRWREHVGPGEDFQFGYRTRLEAEPWFAQDALRRLGAMLEDRVRRAIEEDVEREIAAAFEFAEQSPFPDPSELYADLYKEG